MQTYTDPVDLSACSASEDSLLGHHLRALYNGSPRHREGLLVSFGYHSREDARELAVFIAAVLPRALDWFLQDRIATPIADTPPRLWPKWLSNLGNQSGGK
jgi:hypothetical protein